MEKHPLHLKITELQTSDEVVDAVEKKERLGSIDGEKIKLPNDPSIRIEAYTDRLENIFLNPDKRVRERNMDMLRESIYDAFIIKPEEVPESYFDLQKSVARERGQAVEEIPQEIRKQMIETIIKDQRHSLDKWINYLTSEDAVYPTWFKYFVFRNITKLSQYDKALGKFKSRTDNTTAPYPDVYREPLAQLCDIYEKVKADNKNLKDPEIQELFSRKFPTVYAELITKSLSASMEGREEIKGEWVKYEQGKKGEAEKLYKSLEEKGTGWCTAGLSTSEVQINSGDFYVYYTYDKSGAPTQPRIAIRMNGHDKIGEMRGIQKHQSLEPVMNDILEAKLNEFGPEADRYKQKTEDMRTMTEIERKTNRGITLLRAELVFLYEIDHRIEGFGYEGDPRIEEIRSQRDPLSDASFIFECKPEEIASNKESINENTKVYIGPWATEVYRLLPKSVKYAYEKFPDTPLFMKTIETDPNIQTPEQVEKAILDKGYKINDYAKQILQKTPFSKEKISYKLVEFSVEQLGFPNGAKLKEIFAKIKELGLELCPAEVGPLLRLQYANQPNDNYLRIAMNPISDADGGPSRFRVDHDDSESWLRHDDGYSDYEWYGYSRFVFVSRK
jgi:hypothetical protein